MLNLTRMYKAVQSAIAQIFTIQSSTRFDKTRTTTLARTPSQTGNQRTMVWSGWVKRSSLGTVQTLFSATSYPSYVTAQLGNGSNYADNLVLYFGSSTSPACYTAAAFRDTSAWYHIIIAVDTNQATATSAAIVIVNGVQQTLNIASGASSIAPAQYTNTVMNTAGVPLAIGYWAYNNTNYFDGYIANVDYIDGYPTGINASNWTAANIAALFGYRDATYGQWTPKQYTGVRGVNGFYAPLAGSIMSGLLTTAQIGKDASATTTLDPFWDRTVLACAFDNSLADATGLTTLSNTSNLVTFSSSTKKFGTHAAYFSGSGTQLATTNSNLILGTGDFTIEFWVNRTTISADVGVLELRTSGTDATGLLLEYFPDNTLRVRSAASYKITSTTTCSANTWYHIALVRANGTTTLYINGVNNGSFADTTSYSSGGTLYIGSLFNNTYNLVGYLDDLRITRAARYTAAFDVPTASFLTSGCDPFYEYVVHDINFNSDRTSFLTDVLGATAVANSTYATAMPFSKFGTSSLYCSPLGPLGNNFVRVNQTSATNFTTGDFTAEAWIYPTSYAATYSRFIQAQNSDANTANYTFTVELSSTGTPMFAVYNGGSGYTATATGTTAPLNTWTHVMGVKSGTTIYVFVNGVLAGSATCPITLNNTLSGGKINIGGENAGGYPNLQFRGYIDEVRLSNVARFTSGFTVPSAQYTADANTVLLMHFDDNTELTMNSVTLVNATIDGTQSKFGGKALKCTGSGVQAFFPKTAANTPGMQDFTVEFFVYFNSILSENMILSNYSGGTGGGQFDIEYHSAGKFALYTDAYTAYSSPTAMNLTTARWYHIACSRVNGMLYWFVDGVSYGSVACNVPVGTNGVNYYGIGSTGYGGAGPWPSNCYIDGLKLSVGIGKYTSAFTPPVRETATVGGRYANNLIATNVQASDVVLDSPSSNFAVLDVLAASLNGGTITNGALQLQCASGGSTSSTRSSIVPTAKCYFEVESVSNGGYGQVGVGIASSTSVVKWLGTGGDNLTYGVYGVAYDPIAGKMWICTPSGAWMGGGDPVAGTSPTLTSVAPQNIYIGSSRTSGSNNPGIAKANFGQIQDGTTSYSSAAGGFFKNTPPAGFVAVRASNM